MITEMDSNRFATRSLNDLRIMRILAAALDAVDPFKAVQKYLPELDGRVFGLGIGKAAIPMMDALAERIPLVRRTCRHQVRFRTQPRAVYRYRRRASHPGRAFAPFW